jgi:hypothetical protein
MSERIIKRNQALLWNPTEHDWIPGDPFATVKVVESDLPRNSTVFLAVTDLEVPVENGKRYLFEITLRVNDDHAEGVKFDLNGGTATVSSMWATYIGFDNALTMIKHSAALNTVANADQFAGDGLVKITGTLVASSAGTFVPRFAQKTHTSGSLTILAGSSLTLLEVVNE